MTPDDLVVLAEAVAADGIEAHESSIARLVADLRSAGADSLLLSIVGDRREPSVARERALGMLRLPALPQPTALRPAAVVRPLAA